MGWANFFQAKIFQFYGIEHNSKRERTIKSSNLKSELTLSSGSQTVAELPVRHSLPWN